MEFATANLRLILGLNSGWWMSRRLLQIKYMVILSQMISFPTPNFPLSIMVETYLARLERIF